MFYKQQRSLYCGITLVISNIFWEQKYHDKFGSFLAKSLLKVISELGELTYGQKYYWIYSLSLYIRGSQTVGRDPFWGRKFF